LARLAALQALRAACASAAAAWWDTVFPPRCAGCSRLGAHFCARCAAAIAPVAPPWCASCGHSLSHAAAAPARSRPWPRAGPPGALCDACRAAPWPLRGVRSAGLLRGPLRRAVHRLKYRDRTAAAPALAALLDGPAATLAADGLLDAGSLVLPVPLAAARERQRGYNQAALLAWPFASAYGLPASASALRRVKETAPQVGLDPAQRRANLRAAFAASPEVAGRRVLLIDDVTTTGSTLGNAAAACLRAGAASVCALTLAREASLP
jgi:ComF family protein